MKLPIKLGYTTHLRVTAFPLADANGNAVTYVDNAGNIQAHYVYNAFGGTVSQSGDMDDDFRFRFSSKYLDDETGFYYYGYRYYDSATGRWLSRDPIWEESFSQEYFADIRGEVDKIILEMESFKTVKEISFVKNSVFALFRQEISVYGFVDNMTIRHYDYLGLQSPDADFDCLCRCVEMSKHVPSPSEFMKLCSAKCDEDPFFVPTMGDLLTPPATKPGWSFGKWKSNWKTIMDTLKNLGGKIKDSLPGKKKGK